ncbi:MAG: alpha/beta fold hydrolase [Calditrichaeota bacterium]|nr:MAG: alpha/beta fold hydrolase [Calditrichota bacterium]
MLTILAISLGCSRSGSDLRSYFARQEDSIRTGGIRLIPIQTPAGQFKVWTKQFGHNPRIRVLLLHGGPGATHEYWECLESYLPAEGIEFIYYDQLGSAYSDQPEDTSLWNVARFVEEVEQVRQALHLTPDNFYLLGHSWGGLLAMEYALKYQKHLKGLIISNMMSSAPAYDRYAETVLAKKLDPEVLKEVRALEARGAYDDPRYQQLLFQNFYTQFVCRLPLDRWPDPVNRAFKHINEQIYVSMQGPSEFGVSGKLEHWDVSHRLKEITVPTLVIGARYDTMDPEHMRWMAEQLPNGSFLFCPNGSHMCMYDDQQHYMRGLIAFLKAVDAGKKKVQL